MKFVPDAVTRIAGRSRLKLQHASPTILVVTGVVGFGATAVMAARASRKAEPVIDQHHKDRLSIQEHALTQREEQRAVVALYTDTSIALARVYAPAILMGTVSATSILYGHRLLQARHVATMLAYSGLQDQFLAYRNRVAQTLGADAERDIYDGAHGEWVEDPDHKGEHKLMPKWDAETELSFARPWFDQRCPNWQKNPESNYFFIKSVQEHANVQLQMHGHVFLNDVLKALGLPITPEGQVAGWLWNGEGDNFVDFGFMKNGDPRTQDFLAQRTPDIQLNFNIDGDIQALLMKKKRENQTLQLSS